MSKKQKKRDYNKYDERVCVLREEPKCPQCGSRDRTKMETFNRIEVNRMIDGFFVREKVFSRCVCQSEVAETDWFRNPLLDESGNPRTHKCNRHYVVVTLIGERNVKEKVDQE